MMRISQTLWERNGYTKSGNYLIRQSELTTCSVRSHEMLPQCGGHTRQCENANQQRADNL